MLWKTLVILSRKDLNERSEFKSFAMKNPVRLHIILYFYTYSRLHQLNDSNIHQVYLVTLDSTSQSTITHSVRKVSSDSEWRSLIHLLLLIVVLKLLLNLQLILQLIVPILIDLKESNVSVGESHEHQFFEIILIWRHGYFLNSCTK